jgi:uncharacterized protein DUF6603
VADLISLLASELNLLIEPLERAGRYEFARKQLLLAVGWDLERLTGFPADKLVTDAANISGAAAALGQAAANPPRNFDDIRKLLERIGSVVGAIRDLTTLANDPAIKLGVDGLQLLRGLGDDVLEFLILQYLTRHHPVVLHTAELLTLIRETSVPSQAVVDGGSVVRYPILAQSIELRRLGPLLRDPVGLLRSAYLGPHGLLTSDDAAAAAAAIYNALGPLLAATGARVSGGLDATAGTQHVPERTLAVEFPVSLNGSDAVPAILVELLSNADGGAGLAIEPRGLLTASVATLDWRVTVETSGGLPNLVVTRSGAALPPLTGNLSARALLERIPQQEGSPAVVVGNPSGTRLELGTAAFGGSIELGASTLQAGLDLNVGQCELVISPTDGDGFLASILPDGGLRTQFELGLSWSKARGLSLRGGAGLEAMFAAHASVFGVRLHALHIALQASDPAVALVIGADADLQLGPFATTVDNVGFALELGFDATTPNLEVVDLALRFKPPDGVGLAINAASVAGGGFLMHDVAKAQYVGALELEFGGKMALKAIGLLGTRLPDGSPGYSLLVLITAEGFAPIQLGYGFTLNGVGGLLAVNRQVDMDRLRAGLHQGSLGSILFPSDPVRNAPQIISDLNSIFPAVRDRFLLGPMARIGWGTPTLLTIDLAILLELPDPVRLIALARLRAVLPDDRHALIRLHMDAVGVVDFANSHASLDAVLYDSRLLEFPMTGDMAMRASWGANPHFVLAVGGLNPRFPVPNGFPTLERIALSLADSATLRIRLEAYLALTSNTVQFGAHIDLMAKVDPFSLEGHVGFDALFQFSPFQIAADLSASVALKAGSQVLMAVALSATLTGPSPWHIQGWATFQILFFKASVRFEHAFGPAQTIPLPDPVDVQQLLETALGDPRAWSSELADDEQPLVTLRQVNIAAVVLVHPLATLTLRQRVVPLDYSITRFGTARPSGSRRFHLTVTTTSGPALPTPTILQDAFATAQFRDMTDDDKLTAPAFTQFNSGLRFGTDQVSYDDTQVLETAIVYETALSDPVIGAPDPSGQAVARTRTILPAAVAEAQIAHGAAAQSQMTAHRTRRYQAPRVRPAVSVVVR